MKSMLEINGIKAAAIKEARLAIVEILKTSADQSTKVAALDTLAKLCHSSGGTVISNNMFRADSTTEGK